VSASACVNQRSRSTSPVKSLIFGNLLNQAGKTSLKEHHAQNSSLQRIGEPDQVRPIEPVGNGRIINFSVPSVEDYLLRIIDAFERL
jgi:hypothetical protein